MYKRIIFAISCFMIAAQTIVFADTNPAPQSRVPAQWYYVDGNFGYAWQNYYSNSNWQQHSGIGARNSDDSRGGMVGGVDFGYAINKRIAVELGWENLPSVNVAGNDLNSNVLPSSDLTSWVLYLAAKYMAWMPFAPYMDWFLKGGIGYRRAAVSSSAIVNGDSTLSINSGQSNFIIPVFATGFEMNFDRVWTTTLQYAYYMGSSDSFGNKNGSESLGSMGASVITFGFGYKFAL